MLTGFVDNRWAYRLLALGLLLAAWWAVAAANVWDDLFVPDPGAVWHRLIEGVTLRAGPAAISASS
jgi:taurine transport system permease protein